MNIYQITAKIAKEKYLKLKGRLEKSIASGRFETLSRKKKDTLIHNVEKHRLKLDKFGLKGALAAGSLLAASSVSGQTFFEITGGSLASNPRGVQIANLDADADLEIILESSGSYEYLVNGNANDGFSVSPLNISNFSANFRLADMDGDDDIDIVYEDYYGGIKVRTNNGSGVFSDSGLDLGLDSDFHVIDIDSDGDMDVVAIDASNSTYLEVYLNNGGGTFTQSTIGLGISLFDLAFGDIDNDNDIDLVSANQNGPFRELGVWLNTLDGQGIPTFSSEGGIFSTKYGINEVELADVDGDGDLDVITSTTQYINDSGPSSFESFRIDQINDYGNNNVGWTNIRSSSNLFGSNPVEITPIDIDNDGDEDLILTSTSGAYNPLLLTMDEGISQYDLNITGDVTGGEQVAVGDVDGDGIDDLVTYGSSGSYVHLNTFTPPFPHFVGNAVVAENSPIGTKIGFIETYGQNVSITLSGDDAGLFSLNPTTFSLTTAGELDWEALGSTLNISFNVTLDESTTPLDQVITVSNQAESGRGTLNQIYTQLFGDNSVAKFQKADIDNDGDDDLLVSNFEFGGGGPRDIGPLDSKYSNIVHKQISDGIFTNQPVYDLGKYTSSALEFSDVDGDGDLDIISIGRTSGCCGGEEMRILENEDGQFTSDTSLTVAETSFYSVQRMVSADLDGDGVDDLIVVQRGDAYAFEGTGSGISDGSMFLPGNSTSGVRNAVVGDIDGDGFDDVVLVSSRGESAIVYGSENFFDSSHSSVGAFYTFVASGSSNGGETFNVAISDLDGDGDLDAVVAKEDGVYAYIRGAAGFSSGELILNTLNDNGGESASTVSYNAVFDVMLADMDGDGDDDLVSIEYSKYVIVETDDITHRMNLRLHLNDGDGNFDLVQEFETGGAAIPFNVGPYTKYTLDLMDVDGDDDLDVVINNNASEFLEIFSSKYGFEAGFPTGLMVFKNDNAAPSGLSLDETSFDENLAIATQVATVSVQDLNVDDTHTLFMAAGDGENDVDNSKFVIDGNRLLILESPDFEAQSEYKINIKAIDSGFGSVTQAFTLTVNDLEPEASGIEDESSIALYPNPGKDVMNLRFENKLQGEMLIRVLDISGKTIQELYDEKRSEKWSRSLSMINQEAGVYIVEIEIGDQSFKQRWIKQD